MSSITVGEIFKALRKEMPVELALDCKLIPPN